MFLSSCQTQPIAENFYPVEVQTSVFRLQTYQKITNPSNGYKIYIEGDGHAFTASGQPSSDPTPKDTFMRRLAFNDTSEKNIVYLARPCQYIKDNSCHQTDWTTGRFSKNVIQSEYEAIYSIVGNSSVTLIGFSGGAQIAGLLAVLYPKLNIQKIITISGNLDHPSWTAYHHIPDLKDSLNLGNYKNEFFKIDQIHYVGQKDKVITPEMIENFVQKQAPVIQVPNASHSRGYESIYQQIWNE